MEKARYVVGDDPAKWSDEFDQGDLAVFAMEAWWFLDIEGDFERWTGGIDVLALTTGGMPLGRMTP